MGWRVLFSMGFSTSFERARNWYLNPDEIYQLIYKFWILLGVVSSLWGVEIGVEFRLRLCLFWEYCLL
jgi:cytochrome bd-type quinol oxidase subunit 1